MDEHGCRRQTADTVFMVRPLYFGYNEQTAVNNRFQNREKTARGEALAETDAFLSLLREQGVRTVTADDTPDPATPDSVFPNNWFSTHEDGTLVLYPMFAPNRRQERKEVFLETVRSAFPARRVLDLTGWEARGEFLEGTGSMVLDRLTRTAYACRSPRTSEKVLREFCEAMGYAPFLFTARDRAGYPVYHTNVVMSVGTGFAAVCLDSVTDEKERKALEGSLLAGGRTVIPLTQAQMEQFAGNMLELETGEGKSLVVLSRTALSSLTGGQTELLSEGRTLVSPSLPVIERLGGGSARCMMAEIF